MLHSNSVLLFASWFLFYHLLVRLAYIFLPPTYVFPTLWLKGWSLFFLFLFSLIFLIYTYSFCKCAVGSPRWLPCWQKTLQVALPTKIRVRNHLPQLNSRLAFTVWDIMCFCRNNISVDSSWAYSQQKFPSCCHTCCWEVRLLHLAVEQMVGRPGEFSCCENSLFRFV